MGTVAYRLRADLRHGWRSTAMLVLLVALLGGVVLALAAGARRTGSAYDRLADQINPPELLVSPAGAGVDPTPFYEDVADLDGVRQLALGAGIYAVPEEGTPSERLSATMGSGSGVVASIDGTWGKDVGRFRIVDGRMPRMDRIDEVLVSDLFARQSGLRVGDQLDLVVMKVTDEEVDRAPASAGTPVSVTVTGIGVSYDEVIPLSELNAAGSILATPPFAALADRGDWNYEGAFLDLAPGVDAGTVTEQVRGLVDRHRDAVGGDVFISDQEEQTEIVSDAFRPLAVALAVSATAVGLTALVVAGQAIARSNRSAHADAAALSAIGVRPRDRAAFAVARASLIGVVGAVGAVLVAVALSSRFPVGVARVAEPEPGIDVDVVALVIGAAVLVAACAAAAVPGALRQDRRPELARGRPSRAGGMVASLPPPAAQGARFALADRVVPARSTLLVGAAAIAAVVAAATFAVSLTKLVSTPDRYGQGWDRMVDAQFGPVPIQPILDELGGDPDVEGIAVGDYGEAVVEGRAVPAISLTSVAGEVSVTLEEGAPPRHADEIVLGGAIMDELDVGIGDEVEVAVGGTTSPMEVTGRGVFPRMGQGSFTTTGLGIGALLSAEVPLGVSFFAAEDMPSAYNLDGRLYPFVAIDVGRDPAALDRRLEPILRQALADGAFVGIRTELVPTKVQDLERVRAVPVTTAVVLAIVAVAALAHLLVVSVRERRRELALLRTVGFTGRQLRSTVAWHAAVVVVVALLVGIPIGFVVGRLAWHWFEQGLHAASPPVTPWGWILLALPVAMVAAQLVAAVPAARAARTPAAVVLREE